MVQDVLRKEPLDTNSTYSTKQLQQLNINSFLLLNQLCAKAKGMISFK